MVKYYFNLRLVLYLAFLLTFNIVTLFHVSAAAAEKAGDGAGWNDWHMCTSSPRALMGCASTFMTSVSGLLFLGEAFCLLVLGAKFYTDVKEVSCHGVRAPHGAQTPLFCPHPTPMCNNIETQAIEPTK